MADEEHENDIYTDAVEDLEENDEISPGEGAFMEGYDGKDESETKEDIDNVEDSQEVEDITEESKETTQEE